MDPVPFREVRLPELVLAAGSEELAALGCVGCGGPLELCQPDSARPERLLGACPSCGQWHVLQVRPAARSARPARGRALAHGA